MGILLGCGCNCAWLSDIINVSALLCVFFFWKKDGKKSSAYKVVILFLNVRYTFIYDS